MDDSFSKLCESVVTEVELRQMENIHQARLIINQIEHSCNDAWDALEKMEEVKNKAEKAVKMEPEVMAPISSGKSI